MVKSILHYLSMIHAPNLQTKHPSVLLFFLAPTVQLDMIYWYHVVVCVIDLHFTLEWPWLGGNGKVFITVPIGATFTKLASTVHLDMIYWYHVVVRPSPTFHARVTMVRKKRLSLYYSTYWCYIHQTCTNCSSWHGLKMPYGCLCPWPTFQTWETLVRKNLLGLYYSTCCCYIHQNCTICLSWHDLLMPHDGLCS